MVVNIALVDDHPLFRKGLAIALTAEPGFEVVGEAGAASEAYALAREKAIDVAIVDVLMPEVSGITVASELHDTWPRCRVLGLSVIDEPGLIADMLRAGACGYALKTQPIEQIIEAVRLVHAGIRYLPPTVSTDAIESELRAHRYSPLDRLTRREREIFELVIRGFSNDEIASRLFIARRTVETHRQRVANKLSAHSLPQLQRIAARYGGLAWHAPQLSAPDPAGASARDSNARHERSIRNRARS